MLATILKSGKATQTTIAIVEAFAKIRELARTVSELSETNEDFKQKSLMQKGGEIIADILDDGLKTTDTETTIELNFAVMKFKHTIKRKQ
jgi:exonuclease V gamma subunit